MYLWGKGVRSLSWLSARPRGTVSCPSKVPARGKAAEGSPRSSRLCQPASVASCQFETKALRRRRDTRGGIKRASSQPPALTCLCLSFRDGRTWPQPPTTGRLALPCLPSSPSKEATWVLPFVTLHLAILGPLAFERPPPARGDPRVEDGQEKGPRDGGCAPRSIGCRGLAGSLTSRGRAREDL